MHGLRLAASWILALFLCVMFLWIADLTLFPAEPARNVVFPNIARASGVDLWEPTGRLATGLLQALAALLMLAPPTRRAGAFLGLLIAGGATAAHLIWLGSAAPVEIGSAETDGGQLLYLATGLLVASLLLFVVHPGRRARTG
jgi:hypothetical protein